MTQASTQTRVSKIDSSYYGNTEIRNNIPTVRLRDDEWGNTPAYVIPMKAGEQMTATIEAQTVIQAISEDFGQETLLKPAIQNVASYCNGDQIMQSSTSTSAIVNDAAIMRNAQVTKVAGGSTVTANIANVQESIVSDTKLSVTINALYDCVVVFRNVGDWIHNVTLSGLSTTRMWLAKFDLIIEEYKMFIEDTLTTFSLLMGAAASTYYTVMWLRYRAPQMLAYIMQFIGDVTTIHYLDVENSHGAYIETQANALSIQE